MLLLLRPDQHRRSAFFDFGSMKVVLEELWQSLVPEFLSLLVAVQVVLSCSRSRKILEILIMTSQGTCFLEIDESQSAEFEKSSWLTWILLSHG